MSNIKIQLVLDAMRDTHAGRLIMDAYAARIPTHAQLAIMLAFEAGFDCSRADIRYLLDRESHNPTTSDHNPTRGV